jgi:hypothetical protein
LTKQTHSEVTAEAIDLAIKMLEQQTAGVILQTRREREAAAALRL